MPAGASRHLIVFEAGDTFVVSSRRSDFIYTASRGRRSPGTQRFVVADRQMPHRITAIRWKPKHLVTCLVSRSPCTYLPRVATVMLRALKGVSQLVLMWSKPRRRPSGTATAQYPRGFGDGTGELRLNVDDV